MVKFFTDMHALLSTLLTSLVFKSIYNYLDLILSNARFSKYSPLNPCNPCCISPHTALECLHSICFCFQLVFCIIYQMFINHYESIHLTMPMIAQSMLIQIKGGYFDFSSILKATRFDSFKLQEQYRLVSQQLIFSYSYLYYSGLSSI